MRGERGTVFVHFQPHRLPGRRRPGADPKGAAALGVTPLDPGKGARHRDPLWIRHWRRPRYFWRQESQSVCARPLGCERGGDTRFGDL